MPEPQRSQLHAWRERYAGDQAVLVAPHITLVSGSPRGHWESAAGHVAQVVGRMPAFGVQLGAAKSFQPTSQVVYLPLLRGAGQCRRLHRELLHGPLLHDSQFAYHPHLTITQDAPAALLQAALADLDEVDVKFTVGRVQLFDVREGNWNLVEDLRLA